MSNIYISSTSVNSYTAVEVPASKSISNRLLVLESLYQQLPLIQNHSDSNDTKILFQALEDIKKRKKNIYIGDCGTAMRFLLPLLSITEGEWILEGSERMHERLIGPQVEGLKQLGAEIFYIQNEEFPPVSIRGKKLEGGQIIIDGSVSSQYISGLMMIAPMLPNGLDIFIHTGLASVPYINMTFELMCICNLPVEKVNLYMSDKLIDEFNVNPFIEKKEYPTQDLYKVEADWSGAGYWFSAAALLQGEEIFIRDLKKDSIQGDAVCLSLYENFGVSALQTNEGLLIKKDKDAIEFFSYDFTHCPDLAQTVAVTCAALQIPSRLTGLKNLRHKETDRLFALQQELNQLYEVPIASVEADALYIDSKGISYQSNPFIHTYGDHRMAMAFSVLFLKLNIQIEAPEVVQKSYPQWWNQLKKLGAQISEI